VDEFVNLVRRALDKKGQEFAQQVESRAMDLGFEPTEFARSLRPLLLEVIDKYFPAK